MKAETIAGRFWNLGILNGLLAVFFTAPILVPQLCIATPPGQFGCISSMEIQWPGTWLLVAFFSFVIVGIFGALAWSMAYSRKAALTGKIEGSGGLMWLHLVFFEVGVLGATAMMAAIGFVGGNILARGGGPGVSAAAIQQNIIPPLSSDPTSILWDMPPVVEAAFIGLALLAQLIGFVALFSLKKSPTS
jgi:hypothetical protein